jgi:hypothetical protein
VSALGSAEVADLARGVVVANTPASLSAWLLRHPAVGRLAEDFSEDALLDILAVEGRIQPRTETALAKAYAALVALIIRRRREGRLGDLPVHASLFDWSAPIWEQAARGSPSTSAVLFTAESVSPSLRVRGDSALGRTLVDASGIPIVTVQE